MSGCYLESCIGYRGLLCTAVKPNATEIALISQSGTGLDDPLSQKSKREPGSFFLESKNAK